MPEQGWPEALAAWVDRFQTEIAAWAAGMRATKGPSLAMGVYLQDTPLRASPGDRDPHAPSCPLDARSPMS